VNVVQRQAGDHGLGGRQRIQEAALVIGDAIREWGKPTAGLAEHVRVDVKHRDTNAGKPIHHGSWESPGATPEVKDVRVRRRERRWQVDADFDHLVVVRDEASDLDVVALSVDVEMALDRVRLTTGHRASLLAHLSANGVSW
jgi:hypothetical protein